ncbi:hypothetical protein [Pedobacter sp. WC2423]|uniref:hypothetical protein n=1 Tax=Pedobacter sp. WC2423 TaxID=3234142 RepID=UPI003464FCE0
MRLSVDRAKMQGLHDVIAYLLEVYPAEQRNAAEELLDTLVHAIRHKMLVKLSSPNPKTSYCITLRKEEALAFELWFSQVAKPKDIFFLETHNAQLLSNDINKIYG